MSPDSEKLVAIANALNVTVDFFYREDAVQLDEVEFRKRKSLTATHEVAIKTTVRDRMARYIELERIVNDEQRFTDPLAGPIMQNRRRCREAGRTCARSLGLGPTTDHQRL
jgi:transcriptional regulator with XRE-family HTH domain